MSDGEIQDPDRAKLRRVALSRWENEGGAGCGRTNAAFVAGQAQSDVLPLADAELVQLQIRMIALENLVIALLTNASDRQLDLVRDMAAYILPRPGYTPHRLTIHAAAQIISLVKRSGRFKDKPPQS